MGNHQGMQLAANRLARGRISRSIGRASEHVHPPSIVQIGELSAIDNS